MFSCFIINKFLFIGRSKGGLTMKVRASVKPICEKCKIIKRHGLSISQIGRITGISTLIIRKS